MDANEKHILKEIKKYFDVREFVGKRTYKKYGQSSWKFIDIRLLETVLIIRKKLGKPMYANNWYKKGGRFSQRGLRTNIQQIVRKKSLKDRLYISAHVLGKALDFDVQGMTAHQVREWIIQNHSIFPYKIRLEGNVTWVHLDIISEEKNSKVYVFNP